MLRLFVLGAIPSMTPSFIVRTILMNTPILVKAFEGQFRWGIRQGFSLRLRRLGRVIIMVINAGRELVCRSCTKTMPCVLCFLGLTLLRLLLLFCRIYVALLLSCRFLFLSVCIALLLLLSWRQAFVSLFTSWLCSHIVFIPFLDAPIISLSLSLSLSQYLSLSHEKKFIYKKKTNNQKQEKTNKK